MERGKSLVRIPRHLLHVGLDNLHELGVSETAGSALRELLADLPLVPDASLSAQLVGPESVTLACLAVLARHVGQGLRDHNLALAHDRPRLHLERRKLIFLDVVALEEVLASGVDRPAHEAVLFVLGTTPTVLDLLATRQASGLASFVTSSQPDTSLALWRYVNLDD